MSGTILQRVHSNVVAQPDRTFCHFVQGDDVTAISWGQLSRDIESFRVAADKAGVECGQPALIFLPHHPATHAAFLGLMAAGAVPSVMSLPSVKQDPQLYWRDHRALFEQIGVRLIVTTSAVASVLRHHLGREDVTFIDADRVASSSSHPPIVAGDSQSPAFVQYSSGTTGLKKGVALSHSTVLDQLDRYAGVLGWQQDEIVISWLPLYHDMGLISSFLLPAVHGGTIVSLDPFEWVARPERLLSAIESFGGTRTWMPNFAFLHLARAVENGMRWRLSSMRSWVNCSEPCKPAAFERFIERFAPSGVSRETLHVCYAMAETVFAVSHASSPRARVIDGTAVLSCGRPLSGTQIRIVNSAGADVPEGDVGQVTLRSASLFDGYCHRPDATAERLRDGWLFTGDLGCLDSGELFVTGRHDDVITVCGRNYYAHAIEEVASATPGVLPGRVVAFGVFNHERGTHDIAVVVETDRTAEDAQVERAVYRRLCSSIGLPVQRVIAADRGSLVKTTSGKISRAHNASRFGGLQRQVA